MLKMPYELAGVGRRHVVFVVVCVWPLSVTLVCFVDALFIYNISLVFIEKHRYFSLFQLETSELETICNTVFIDIDPSVYLFIYLFLLPNLFDFNFL